MNIAILGAGLVGRLLAYRLAQQGHHIDLYERGGPSGEQSAAYIAASMLAPVAESATAARLITELGLASLKIWPQWLVELDASLSSPQDSAQERVPIFFQQQGTLVLWHHHDEEEAQRFYQRLDVSLATRHHCAPQKLQAAALAALEPSLASRFMQGIYLPGEGQLDNRALLDGLLAYVKQKNVHLHWQHNAEVEAIKADRVIDCRGLGAQTSWNSTCFFSSNVLRGVRGEVIRLHAPEVALKRPIRLLHPRYPLYIAPKPNHIYVIGATEIESEDLSEISVRSTLELLSAAYTVHPGFGEARILEMRSQCRPTLANHLPQIRWDGQRCIAINGLYRHGYLIAPAVVQAALNLLTYIDGEKCDEPAVWQAQQPWPELFELASMPEPSGSLFVTATL